MLAGHLLVGIAAASAAVVTSVSAVGDAGPSHVALRTAPGSRHHPDAGVRARWLREQHVRVRRKYRDEFGDDDGLLAREERAAEKKRGRVPPSEVG